MSDDKRKNARTQGRFSSDKEARPNRRDKEKQKSSKSNNGSVNGSKTSKGSSEPKAAEGFSVEYQEGSSHTFKDLLADAKPVEIRMAGAHQLSSTENGISRIIYEPNFLEDSEAEELMSVLHKNTPWSDKKIVIHGKETPQPRLVAWYGPFPYSYSGAVLEAAEMPPVIENLKCRVEDNLRKQNLEVRLNSVLLNLYRNEKDSVAWHSDDELSMGIEPTIASVSLGAIRKFEMKPKTHAIEQDPKLETENLFFVNLTPGSLIIMDGCMQQDWQHRVPKEYHDRNPRINLTFRTVHRREQSDPEVPLPISETRRSRQSSSPKKNKTKSSAFDGLDLNEFPSLGNNAAEPEKDCALPPTNDSVDFAGSIRASVVSESAEDDESFKRMVSSDDDPDVECSVTATQVPSSDLTSADQEIEQEATRNGMESSSSQNKPAHSESKSQLNAFAIEFVPKNLVVPPQKDVFQEMDIGDLAYSYLKDRVPLDKVQCFQSALMEHINTLQRSFFSSRDWVELEVYLQINDGSQSEKNQATILARICSMINYNLNRNRDGYSPARQYSYKGIRDITQRNKSSFSRPHNRR